MLEIECKEYFAEVMKTAETMKLVDQLKSKLDYLGTYACHTTPEDTRCRLFKDFASLSFQFVMEKRKDGVYSRWFNGGLVYQGPGQPADGSAPSLTVSIAEGTGWFVHT